MRKHVLPILLAMLIVLTMSGCGKKDERIQVAEMEAYIAAPVETEMLLGFTLFTLNENKDLLEKMDEMVFVGFGDNSEEWIEITDAATDRIGVTDKFSAYELLISYQGKRAGVEDVDELKFLHNGKTITVPIEEIVFDFGEDTGAAYADTWESPGASSNGTELVCSYLYDESVDAVRIYYGEDDYVDLTADEIANGEVYIPLEKDAAINYICTKVELEVDGKTYTTYGHGCYCGAMSVDDDTMEQMWMND